MKNLRPKIDMFIIMSVTLILFFTMVYFVKVPDFENSQEFADFVYGLLADFIYFIGSVIYKGIPVFLSFFLSAMVLAITFVLVYGLYHYIFDRDEFVSTTKNIK